jgi:hypothetical protein
MKHLRSCVSLTLLGVLVNARALATDDFKPEPGFVSLFNGKDLTGWCFRADDNAQGAVTESFAEKNESSDARFGVGIDALVVHPRTPRKIQKLFTQQEFAKDFILKLEFRATVNADSGIFVRGPQLQCRDYLVAGPYKELKKYKAQDWNEIVIEVKGGVAHCTCNGEVLNAEMKVPATGAIGFEGDRGMMEYRRIRVKELP